MKLTGLGLLLALILGIAPAAFGQNDGYGPGRVGLSILAGRYHEDIGAGGIWNSRDKLHIQLDPAEGWRIKSYKVDLGGGLDYSPPLTTTGNPKIGHFDYKEDFNLPYMNEAAEDGHAFRRTLVLDLEEDLGLQWGSPFADLRVQGVAIFVELVRLDDELNVLEETGAWVVPELVTWVVEETIAEADSEVLVDGEDVVAVAETGELIDEDVVKVEKTNKGRVHKNEHQNAQRTWEVDEAEELIAFDGGRWGWWFRYEIAHPATGHFIDSPVAGLYVETPTYEGTTDETASFDYFPGEMVDVYLGSVLLGSTVADHKISPLDFYSVGDTDDHRVINMARLLQSLDVDGDAQGTIVIMPEAVTAFETAMDYYELTALDFADDYQIDNVIARTIEVAAAMDPPQNLTQVGYEDAKGHLDESLNNIMFRKNISKTPDLASTKAKMNIMPMWFPALPANSVDGTEVVEVPYYDADGNLIRTATEAKPIIVTYTDDDPVTGAADTWAAISRDDGNTWKRQNLSRSGDLSSFTTAYGEVYYGGVKKPVFSVQGNKIMVAWGSKYAHGGKPRYAIDPEDDYPYDDAYYTEDVWGVGGPQLSHDYTEEGYPEVGEVPHQALWTCRGIIATQKDVDAGLGEFVGDIVWFKPERLTSGRRDVNQIFLAVAGNAGFAMVWQEDPNGVKPGNAAGPGPGWGGATTSHKTDIWYSYLEWGNHSKVDGNFVAGGDPEHDLDVIERPKALVPWSLPVRLSDNEVVNTDNIRVELDGDGLPARDGDGNLIVIPNDDATSPDGDGTHLYASTVPGLISGDWYEFVNEDGETKTVAITDDGRLLDGDTGASRGNIFIQPYWTGVTKADGTPVISAWTIITYEETKGAGAGPPDTDDPDYEGNSDGYVPEEGKNVIYHSFDFKNPDLVAAGRIVNRPEFIDANGDNYVDPAELVYLVDEEGGQILDYLERPMLAYENARRGRFMPQGIGAFGPSRTALVMVHKQGEEGAGRPSDILLRRWEYPANAKKFAFKNTAGNAIAFTIYIDADGDKVVDPDEIVNPYGADCLVGTWLEDSVSGQGYYADGVQNMSSVTPTVTTESTGDPEVEDAYGSVKVVEWEQTVDNLNDPTGYRTAPEGVSDTFNMGNPYDDARAHRGSIRGDLVTCGFSYTANWAAARNGNDHFDFYIRRSYDGGVTWTNDPAGSGTSFSNTFTYPSGTQSPGDKVEVVYTFEPGEFEIMRNLSQLPNHTQSVIEPRIVAVPGTIKVNGAWTGIPEDKQNAQVFYVAYGTSTNPKKDPVTGEQEDPVPMDLWWSVTTDMGESYYLREWDINPDSDGTLAGETVLRWDYMAKGDQEQGEVQLRETPDGSRFYASWLDEGEDGSDIVFRRILPPVFDANVAAADEPVVDETAADLDESSAEDFSSDAGGE